MLVITTFWTPAVPTGVTAVIWVAEVLITVVATAPPIVTLNAPPEAKFVPVIVTGVPPAIWPYAGEMLVNVGAAPGGLIMNPLVRVPVCVLGLVTITSHGPRVAPGGIAMVPGRGVADTKATEVATIVVLWFFRVMVAPVTKLVPYTLIGTLAP